MFILRYKYPEKRECKVPGNLKIGGHEVPIGLGLITGLLFLIAIANLLTKQQATIAGVIFSGAFYVLLKLHRFRKTYADTLHEEGVSVNTIRIRLGHESLDVTLAYLKGKDAESEEAQEHANSSSLALYA